MSSSDAMVEASSVYLQYVKIDHDSRRRRPGCSNSLISLVVGWFSTTDFFI